MTLIKVCGITNIDDALACVQLGADFLGFVFADSLRRVEPGTAKHIIEALGGRGFCRDARQSGHGCPRDPDRVMDDPVERRLKTVGVFTEESDEILRIMDECGLDYAQLHGGQSEDFARKIGADRVIRVARVKDESSIAELAAHQEAAFYLLDTYKKGQAGGTGETFNWALAAQAKSLGKPIFLSGGLNPDNVYDAIRLVRPYAVDVSSGIERSPGVKDINKVKEFIDHVREADDAS